MQQISSPIQLFGIVWVDVLRFTSKRIKMDIKIVNLLVILFCCFEGIYAQSSKDSLAMTREKPYFEIGVDAANSLVWRCRYTQGANIQPSFALRYKCFELGGWAYSNYKDGKMAELWLSYKYRGASLTLMDYWIDNLDFSKGYFIYDNKTNLRALEVIGQYTLPPIPLTFLWSTFFFKDDVNIQGRRIYSSYLEINYLFSLDNFQFKASVGATPWASLYQDGNGFKLTNIGIDAQANILKISNFKIPMFSQLVFNPYREQLYWIVGVRFRLHTKI